MILSVISWSNSSASLGDTVRLLHMDSKRMFAALYSYVSGYWPSNGCCPLCALCSLTFLISASVTSNFMGPRTISVLFGTVGSDNLLPAGTDLDLSVSFILSALLVPPHEDGILVISLLFVWRVVNTLELFWFEPRIAVVCMRGNLRMCISSESSPLFLILVVFIISYWW